MDPINHNANQWIRILVHNNSTLGQYWRPLAQRRRYKEELVMFYVEMEGSYCRYYLLGKVTFTGVRSISFKTKLMNDKSIELLLQNISMMKNA